MTSTSTILVIVFSISSFILFATSLSLLGFNYTNPYKANKKLYAIPGFTALFFLAALFSGLTCLCNWAAPSSSFCSNNNNNNTSPSSNIIPLAPTPAPPPSPPPPPSVTCYETPISLEQDGTYINAISKEDNSTIGRCIFKTNYCAEYALNYMNTSTPTTTNLAIFHDKCRGVLPIVLPSNNCSSETSYDDINNCLN